jgi:aspartyl-tRNA(Asn)/glutamyl-tRNA(Gln) amidotransferase subunit B
MDWQPVVGLEIHAQLLTESKMFCGCSSEFGLPPNSATCPVCLGLPGALPVVNRRAVEMGVSFILAVGGEVQAKSAFARKNYFYPDLPKGYQISQYTQPLGGGGSIQISQNGTDLRIALTRVHVEEDAARMIHPESETDSFSRLDFNRCGVPLLEIVTEPEIYSPHQAYLFIHQLKQIVEYLGICGGNMEQGSLRCDANVSVRPAGSKVTGVRTEVKNLNSIRGVEKAIEFEVNRQIGLLESGGQVVPETLLYNDGDGKCYAIRSKETSEDYRYFPEPDLSQLIVDNVTVERIREQLPELPNQKRKRFVSEYGLSDYDSQVLTTTRDLADYFEAASAACSDPKSAANWVQTEMLRELRDHGLAPNEFPVAPQRLGELIDAINRGAISGSAAKRLFAIMLADRRDVATLVREFDLALVVDRAQLAPVADQVLADHPEQVDAYRRGRNKLLEFFVGQMMRATEGKADPRIARELLIAKLEKR